MKKTIEVSTRGTFLSLRDSRLAIKREKELLGHIPFEDIGLMILDSTGISLSSGVLKALADSGGGLLACDDDHIPCGIFLPIFGNSLLSERLRFQVNASKPLQKNIWAKVIQAKIRNQAAVLGEMADKTYLYKVAQAVRSGDEGHHESRAAQFYWPRVLAGVLADKSQKFRRLREGKAPNGLLNYGYTVLRAAMARAICAAGLQPSFGIHHTNKYSGFCLADDLMEPYRPFVDKAVVALVADGHDQVNQETKPKLLGVLGEDVWLCGEATRLGVALETTASSLARCFEEQVKNGLSAPQAVKAIKLPEFPSVKPCQ